MFTSSPSGVAGRAMSGPAVDAQSMRCAADRLDRLVDGQAEGPASSVSAPGLARFEGLWSGAGRLVGDPVRIELIVRLHGDGRDGRYTQCGPAVAWPYQWWLTAALARFQPTPRPAGSAGHVVVVSPRQAAVGIQGSPGAAWQPRSSGGRLVEPAQPVIGFQCEIN